VKLSRKAFGAALIKHDGNVAAVAREYGMDRVALWERLRKDEGLQAVLAAAEEIDLNAARGNISQAIHAGDLPTSRWFLERKGKHLGFGNSIGLRLTEAEAAQLVANMDTDKLKALAEGG
jgi:hypothetical protein